MSDRNITNDRVAHTPGPWWVEDRRKASGKLQVQAKHRGEGSSYCVASVNEWEVPEANARLIAAAPTMLALLKTVENLAGLCDIDEKTEAYGWGAWLHETRELLAALRQVEP